MTTELLASSPQILELVQQAAEWRLIGLLLECPSDDWQAHIAALAAEVADATLCEAAAACPQEASEGLYHTTFGPGGPAAPREVSYRDGLLFGKVLAELRGCYQAFAYLPSAMEAPDHVAIEAGFVSYLRLKEAYALARGAVEEAEITAQATRDFIAEHLAWFAEPLAHALQCSGIVYLAQAGAAVLARVGPRPQTTGEALACIDCCDCGDTLECSEAGPQ